MVGNKRKHCTISYLVYTSIVMLVLSTCTQVHASETNFPREGDYIKYKLTRKSLPDFITSTEFTVTFYEAPFNVQLAGDETILITESESYPTLFKVEFSAENWTLLFPEAQHDSSIYSWIIVIDTENYEGYTGSSVYPVSSPFEEETLFPFLLNPQDITDSTLPKEKHTGKISGNTLIFWILENSAVHSSVYIEEDYGLLMYVIQEVYDPVFLLHDYSLELLECKLGDLEINEPINNMQLIDIEPDPEPESTGIPGFGSLSIILGLFSAILLAQIMRKKGLTLNPGGV